MEMFARFHWVKPHLAYSRGLTDPNAHGSPSLRYGLNDSKASGSLLFSCLTGALIKLEPDRGELVELPCLEPMKNTP